ncbi:MAG: GNAT family N-acetyltransferase [Anaerolineaceae bacterium]|nr:GNAT family N-acetyltransferase [Anaerolineaceae bacterium]
MDIQLHIPTRSDRNLVRRLMELYQYDFSEYDGQDLDDHGCFGYGDLDYFWFEPTHSAFLVTVEEKLAGFVLIDDEVVIPGNERSVSEFFIMRKYRRLGVGKQVAFEVFRRLPAKWEVRVIEQNSPAQDFWRSVITDYTQDKFQEKLLENDEWQGPVFYFDNHGQ